MRFDRPEPHHCGTAFAAAELSRALERGELTLHYQPQICLADNRLAGFEALLRWEHPSRGTVLPDAFLGAIRSGGYTELVTCRVLDAVHEQLAQWRPHLERGVGVAVNMIPAALTRPAVLDALADIVATAPANASRLSIELSEAASVEEVERAWDDLARVTEGLVRLVLDDFGAGYGALHYLRSLPIHMVKIDRSVIGRLPDDDEAIALTEAVIRVAQSRGIWVVAEGVETEAQHALVKAAGCDIGQGYHYGYPEPPAVLEQRWLPRKAG